MNIHARIHAFLQQQTIASQEASATQPQENYTKAGVVPFTRQGGWRYLVMKPSARLPGLGAPPFQLCKGTRMHLIEGTGWRDIRPGEKPISECESLAATALREGVEELGLRLENIAQIIELGAYRFSSATTGKDKHMWLFAAEMKDAGDFAPDAELAAGTSARKWISAAEFAVVGRPDHRYILQDVETRLTRYYKE